MGKVESIQQLVADYGNAIAAMCTHPDGRYADGATDKAIEARRLFKAIGAALSACVAECPVARPLDDWHEDMGCVVWWKFPIDEPAWIGQPGDSDWPGYHTHFTPHPEVPTPPSTTETETEGETK